MYNKILILLISLSLTLRLKNIEESEIFLKGYSYEEAKSKIRSGLKVLNDKVKYSYPSNYQTYITNFVEYPGIEYIEDYIEFSEFKNGKFGDLAFLQNYLALLQFTQESSLQFSRHLSFNCPSNADGYIDYCNINNYLITALRIGDYVMCGIIHSNIKASLQSLYEKFGHSEMVRQWWCLWLCETREVWYENRRRNPSSIEQDTIKNALEAKSGELITNKLNSI